MGVWLFCVILFFLKTHFMDTITKSVTSAAETEQKSLPPFMDGNGPLPTLPPQDLRSLRHLSDHSLPLPWANGPDRWSANEVKNIFGEVPKVVEMQGEAGAAGTIHGALQGRNAGIHVYCLAGAAADDSQYVQNRR